jgi:hypothetical protein
MLSPKSLSALIRASKKKAKRASPELVDTDAANNIKNPNDILNMETDARIEQTLDTPERIDGREAAMDADDGNMGLTEPEKKRMKRLEAYLDKMEMHDDGD